MIKVGETIRRLRAKAQLSQKELASAAEITPSFLSLVENNRRDPSLLVLRRISRALDVPEEIIIWDSVEIPIKTGKRDRELFDLARLIVRRYFESKNAVPSGEKPSRRKDRDAK